MIDPFYLPYIPPDSWARPKSEPKSEKKPKKGTKKAKSTVVKDEKPIAVPPAKVEVPAVEPKVVEKIVFVEKVVYVDRYVERPSYSSSFHNDASYTCSNCGSQNSGGNCSCRYTADDDHRTGPGCR